MDYKQEMVKRLKDDCKILIEKKLPKVLGIVDVDDKGINTYRNLTKALAENIKLIEEYENDYKPMWSIYKTGVNQDSLTPQVAVWMQNSNGDISSHQIFDIDYKMECDNNIVAYKKNTNFYDDWYETMKSFVSLHGDNHKVIIPVSEANRGVGKTTFLIKQALENNGIYVCASKMQTKHIRNISKKLFNDVVDIAYFTDINDVESKFVSDRPLYIDEGVDLNRIDLEKNKYVAFRYVKVESK